MVHIKHRLRWLVVVTSILFSANVSAILIQSDGIPDRCYFHTHDPELSDQPPGCVASPNGIEGITDLRGSILVNYNEATRELVWTELRLWDNFRPEGYGYMWNLPTRTIGMTRADSIMYTSTFVADQADNGSYYTLVFREDDLDPYSLPVYFSAYFPMFFGPGDVHFGTTGGSLWAAIWGGNQAFGHAEPWKVVPEPATWLLLLPFLGWLAVRRRD